MGSSLCSTKGDVGSSLCEKKKGRIRSCKMLASDIGVHRRHIGSCAMLVNGVL